MSTAKIDQFGTAAKMSDFCVNVDFSIYFSIFFMAFTLLLSVLEHLWVIYYRHQLPFSPPNKFVK